MKDRPGLVPYSNEWVAEHMSNVPEPLVGVVRELCRAFALPGEDARSVVRIIKTELGSQLKATHVLCDKRVVKPSSIKFEEHGQKWSYYGIIISSPDKEEEGRCIYYPPDEVDVVKAVVGSINEV